MSRFHYSADHDVNDDQPWSAEDVRGGSRGRKSEEHPPLDRVGDAPEAVQLQLEQPSVTVERLLAANGDDRLHRQEIGRSGQPSQERESRMRSRRNSAATEMLLVGWAAFPSLPMPSAASARPRLGEKPGSLLTGSSLEMCVGKSIAHALN